MAGDLSGLVLRKETTSEDIQEEKEDEDFQRVRCLLAVWLAGCVSLATTSYVHCRQERIPPSGAKSGRKRGKKCGCKKKKGSAIRGKTNRLGTGREEGRGVGERKGISAF